MPVITDKRIYKGQSMAGTFSFGDQLIIEKVQFSNVRCGDILVYRRSASKGINNEVVHRVIGSTPDGFVMQGDNNLHPDETYVTEKNLVGRITHMERAGNKHRLECKHSGLLFTRFFRRWLHIRQIMLRFVRVMGRRSYCWLRESSLVTRLWRPPVVKVRLLTPRGPMIKYIWRNRTVAFHWINEGRLKCRKPYDLVIGPKEKMQGR